MIAQLAVTAVLQLAVAVAVGAILLERGRRLALSATLAALLASAFVLALEASSMAEVPLTASGQAIGAMLTATHYGFAWKIGAASLAAAGILLAAGRANLLRTRTSLLALAAFLYSRSMVSHAAADGDFTIAIAVDWMHLMAISAWVGMVIVAGLRGSAEGARRLSARATAALAVVVATGLVGAWRNVGAVGHLVDDPYGGLLLVKLAFVATAVALGGFNRVVVMPKLPDHSAARRFVLVLRVEASVLLVVMVLAALLAATPPPA